MEKVKFNKRKIIILIIFIPIFILVTNLKILKLKTDESPNKEFTVIEYTSIRIDITRLFNPFFEGAGNSILYDNIEQKTIHRFYKGFYVFTEWSNDTLYYYYSTNEIDFSFAFKLPRNSGCKKNVPPIFRP